MSLYDYFTGQQSWTDYVSNRDLGRRFEQALTKTGDRFAIQVNAVDRTRALAEGLGALSHHFEQGTAEISYELQGLSSGVDALRADFHILMGDLVWKIELQTAALTDILKVLQAPLDTAAKELRARAVDAYRNGWYEEALGDFLQAEEKNYQDFTVQRSIGNIFLYHLVNLTKAEQYFQKAARYARPRDCRQASEAEFFAGIACGLQQKYNEALAHMEGAVELNQTFLEAHYMKASFAALVGDSGAASRGIEAAIAGDPRYHERCVKDACFDSLRPVIQPVLDRLISQYRKEALRNVDECTTILQRTKQSGVPETEVRPIAKRIEELRSQLSGGTCHDYFTVDRQALECLCHCLRTALVYFERSEKENREKIDRTNRELGAAASSASSELRTAKEERAKLDPIGDLGLAFLILFVAVLLLTLGWQAGAGFVIVVLVVAPVPGFWFAARGFKLVTRQRELTRRLQSLETNIEAIKVNHAREIQRLENSAQQLSKGQELFTSLLAQRCTAVKSGTELSVPSAR